MVARETGRGREIRIVSSGNIAHHRPKYFPLESIFEGGIGDWARPRGFESVSKVCTACKRAHRSKYAAVAPTKISITEPASNHPLKGCRPWPNDRRFQHFSNHAAERYGSTRGARSPGVNPWLVARSVSCHGCAVATSPHLCCPEGISSLVFRKVCRRDPLRGTVDVGDS